MLHKKLLMMSLSSKLSIYRFYTIYYDNSNIQNPNEMIFGRSLLTAPCTWSNIMIS